MLDSKWGRPGPLETPRSIDSGPSAQRSMDGGIVQGELQLLSPLHLFDNNKARCRTTGEALVRP